MTRDEALQIARKKYVEADLMTTREANQITRIWKKRRWPIFGPIVAWETREQLGDTRQLGIVEVDDATRYAILRTTGPVQRLK